MLVYKSLQRALNSFLIIEMVQPIFVIDYKDSIMNV